MTAVAAIWRYRSVRTVAAESRRQVLLSITSRKCVEDAHQVAARAPGVWGSGTAQAVKPAPRRKDVRFRASHASQTRHSNYPAQ